MKFLIAACLLFLVYSCSRPQKKFTGTTGLASSELIKDSIFVTEESLAEILGKDSIAIPDLNNFLKNTNTAFIINPGNQDPTNPPKKTQTIDSKTKSNVLVILEFPKRTKVIKWYSIGYMPDGSGLLTATAVDEKVYKVPLANSSVVSATANLMQNAYVRLDTLSYEIYAYKTSESYTLKAF